MVEGSDDDDDDGILEDYFEISKSKIELFVFQSVMLSSYGAVMVLSWHHGGLTAVVLSYLYCCTTKFTLLYYQIYIVVLTRLYCCITAFILLCCCCADSYRFLPPAKALISIRPFIHPSPSGVSVTRDYARVRMKPVIENIYPGLTYKSNSVLLLASSDRRRLLVPPSSTDYASVCFSITSYASVCFTITGYASICFSITSYAGIRVRVCSLLQYC